jgi:ribosomal-protein-alanine N-acetyltransferase
VRVQTRRLDLIATTLAHIEVELERPERLGAMLSAIVPEGWPPGEYDRDAMEFFRAKLSEGGAAAEGWYGWYGVRRATQSDPAAVVVGGAGFLGPPSADGDVELGYSTVPQFRGHGFATEMSQALVERALSTAGVLRVLAHTNDDNPASIAVLERCGFRREGTDAETGRIRFARGRDPSLRSG